MPKPNRCEVCGEPMSSWVSMCRACRMSYERTADVAAVAVVARLPRAERDALARSVTEAILWAAKRARWYAERKAAKLARARQPIRRNHG